MRSRKLAYAAYAAALMVTAWILVCVHLRSRVPVASITFVGYTTNFTLTKSTQSTTQHWLCAEMVLANVGRSSLVYWAGDSIAWARAQTAVGWRDCHVLPDVTKSYMVQPGSNATISVWLPEDTVRWQCGLFVQTPSVRQLVGHKVGRTKLFMKLYPFSVQLLRLIPSRLGREMELRSGTFEVDQRPESPADKRRGGVDAGRQPVFVLWRQRELT